MDQLTPRQAEVFSFIQKFRAANQIPPTRTEIARELGFASRNAAEEHLQALARKGFIRLAGDGRSRNIFVLRDVEHGA